MSYELRYEQCAQPVKVLFNGVVVAETERAIVVHEARLAPAYYFPRDDVRTDLLSGTRHHTHCPFRGDASYWTLKVGERVAENVAWSYEEPFVDAVSITGHIAFHLERMDALYQGDESLTVEEFVDDLGYPNPLADWLVQRAWRAATMRELVIQFALALRKVGIPVWRLWMTVRTLHPQLLSTAYIWRQDDELAEVDVTHSMATNPSFLASPVKHIYEGAGGVRRRLDVPEPQLDYPVVRDMKDAGATDYVAMPFVFSDGQINALSLTTKSPGGFSTEALGNIYEILPLLSRLFEVHATRRTAANLLSTYLGRQSGQQVLNGLVRRGDGEDVHAVIWFCDLRDSTRLAESMPRAEFLHLLNQYFECMAGAVLERGGEVLRFIGDAVLAIFPIPGGTDNHEMVSKTCETALRAAQEAKRCIEELNVEREAAKQQPLGFGVGLHVGDVMYGNIGTADRLEFTVIGAAANEAARLESMTKQLAQPILCSAVFARHLPQELRSLGRHTLRGVGTQHELFTAALEDKDKATDITHAH